METNQSKSHLRGCSSASYQQCHFRIGQKGAKNRVSGQTFLCPSEGELDCIEIFSSHVTNSGPVNLTIHAFNAETKAWVLYWELQRLSSITWTQANGYLFHLMGYASRKE